MAKFTIGVVTALERERGEEGEDGMIRWAERVEAAVVERLNGEETVQPTLVPSSGSLMATPSGGFASGPKPTLYALTLEATPLHMPIHMTRPTSHWEGALPGRVA
jgi:hypothetical protein